MVGKVLTCLMKWEYELWCQCWAIHKVWPKDELFLRWVTVVQLIESQQVDTPAGWWDELVLNTSDGPLSRRELIDFDTHQVEGFTDRWEMLV